MFDPDGQANHVGAHTGFFHFAGVELAVCGGGRMTGQRLGVADVHQAGEQLQCILEARTGRDRITGIGTPTLHRFAGRCPPRGLTLLGAALRCGLQPKTDDAGSPAAHVFLHQRVVFVVRQTGVVDPAHLGMVLQMCGNLDGVLADAVHAQRQGFDALQDLERVHG